MEGVEELTNMVLNQLMEVESAALRTEHSSALSMSDSDDDLSVEERRLATARFSILEAQNLTRKRRQRALTEQSAVRSPAQDASKRKVAKRRERGWGASMEPQGQRTLEMPSSRPVSVRAVLEVLGVQRVAEAEAASFVSHGEVADFLEHHDAPELQGEHFLKLRYYGVEQVPLQTVKYRCVHMLSCALRPDVPLQRIETCIARTARKLNLRVSNWLPGHITTEKGGYQSGVPEWHLMDCQVVLDIRTKVRTLLVRYILVLPLPAEIAEQGRHPGNKQSYTKASNMALKVALVQGGVSLSTIGSCRHLPKEAFRKGVDREAMKALRSHDAEEDADEEPLEPASGSVPVAGARLVPMALVHETQESELASAGLFDFSPGRSSNRRRSEDFFGEGDNGYPDVEVGFSLDVQYCVQLWSFSRHTMRTAYKRRLAGLDKDVQQQADLADNVRRVLDPCFKRYKLELPSDSSAGSIGNLRHSPELSVEEDEVEYDNDSISGVGGGGGGGGGSGGGVSRETMSDLASIDEVSDALGSKSRLSTTPRKRDARRRRQKNAPVRPSQSADAVKPTPPTPAPTLELPRAATMDAEETKDSGPFTPVKNRSSHGFSSRESSFCSTDAADLTTCDFGLRVPLHAIAGAAPLCEGSPPKVRKDADDESAGVALAYLIDQRWLEKAIRELWSRLDAKCDAKLASLVQKAKAESARRILATKRRNASLFGALASAKSVSSHSYTKTFWKLLENFAKGSSSAAAARGLAIVEDKEAVLFWTNIMYASTSTGIFYLTPKHVVCVVYSIFGFAKEIISIHLQSLKTVKVSEGLLSGVALTWQQQFTFGDGPETESPRNSTSSAKRHEGLVIIPTMQRAQHLVDLISSAKESLSVPASHFPSPKFLRGQTTEW